MTHDTLRGLVRDAATDHEPPFTLTPDEPLARGRRRVRGRRLTAGVACAAVLGLGAVLVPQLGDGGPGGGTRLDPATAAALERYDAALMPALIDETVRRAVAEDAPPFRHGTVTARDSQDQELPPRYFDKASGWSADYDWGAQRQLRVVLLHSGSESEGDPDAYCADGVDEGYYLGCSVRRLADGTVVITTEYALRRQVENIEGDPDAVTWYAVTDPDRVDPAKLWFGRSVEARRGGIYLTSVTERVHAADRAEADRGWLVPTATMRDIATDPALVFPAPDKGPDGCTFVLPGSPADTACAVVPQPE